MRVALIYPPSCDPTAPYLSVPTLAAWLRRHGVDVVPIDANLEAWEHLLRRGALEALAARIERRLGGLEARSSLSHPEQLVYTQLWQARGDAAAVPGAIEAALATLRDRTGARFYDAGAYEAAVATVEAALRVVSAAHAPLVVDMVGYRTPFSLLTAEEIARGGVASPAGSAGRRLARGRIARPALSRAVAIEAARRDTRRDVADGPRAGTGPKYVRGGRANFRADPLRRGRSAHRGCAKQFVCDDGAQVAGLRALLPGR
jgi:hypothetical protein